MFGEIFSIQSWCDLHHWSVGLKELTGHLISSRKDNVHTNSEMLPQLIKLGQPQRIKYPLPLSSTFHSTQHITSFVCTGFTKLLSLDGLLA